MPRQQHNGSINHRVLFFIAAIIVLGLGGMYAYMQNHKEPTPTSEFCASEEELSYECAKNKGVLGGEVTTFEECAKEGNPIQESYPEVCVARNGERFVNPTQQAPAPPTIP